MKKGLIAVVLTVFLLTVFATTVIAAPPPGKNPKANENACFGQSRSDLNSDGGYGQTIREIAQDWKLPEADQDPDQDGPGAAWWVCKWKEFCFLE